MIYSSMQNIASTNYHLLAAKQDLYRKAFLLTNNTEKSQENEPVGRKKKDLTDRVTGVGRRKRKEIVKRNQMTALRWGGGEIPGLPSQGWSL